MNIFSKIKRYFSQRHMDRMQKRLTKYLQKREKRRHLMEREILIFLRRKKEKRDLNPHQSLVLAKSYFKEQLQEERMEVVRDRGSKSVKVILKNA